LKWFLFPQEGGNYARLRDPFIFLLGGIHMRKFVCLLLLLSLLLPGCGSSGEPAAETTPPVPQTTFAATASVETAAVTFTDDLGREVTVDDPQRVACLIGSFADIWYLAGGADKIVATANDTWTYFDLPLREDVINLGATKELDVEKLLSCEPDLVIASGNTALNVELEPTFREMGLNVAYFTVSTFDEYLHMLSVCTQITGCEENFQRYGTELQERVKAAIAQADGSEPSVLYIRASGSSCKVKNSQGSVLGEMLADLGCRNIADQGSSLLEELSMEAIIQEDPDYIFVILQSSDPSVAQKTLDETLLSNPAWATLTAVEEGRYYVLDPTLYNLKPNERWADAYEQLADILYGQA